MEQKVTERTQELAESNVQLIAARQEAEAANKAKSTFLAHMSHELRTPLNAILGYTQLIRRDQTLPTEQQQRLIQVQQGGEHLLTLINDILDLSRVEAGKLKLRLSDYFLPGTLADIAEMFNIQAESKDLQFTYKTADLPDMVHGDATMLRQVLINLLANGVKFTAEGEVALRVTRIEEEESAADDPSPLARIKFVVEDSGIGISEEKLEAIFEPFDQVYNPDQPHEGTGLGLTISRRLVELMGGRLAVSSMPGKGSRFWFEIELPVVAESALGPEEEKPAITGFEGAQKKILIVDDIESNRGVLMEMLSPLGFDLVDVSSGEEGLAIAADFQPDLILTDLVMPGMDGMEMVRQIRQLPGLEEVIVFAVSASAFPQEKERSIDLGANAFIAKPVQFDRLLIVLQNHLNLKPLYEEKQEGTAEIETAQNLPAAAPPDLAAAIVESARKGNITMLTEQIEQLEALGDQYNPLAGELRRLAGKYRFDAIVTLLEPFVVQKVNLEQ
jgi:CheY-like chemotaxis protein